MRIWDKVPPAWMCRQHLLGEHFELHSLWTIIQRGKKTGYTNHPETKRWAGNELALARRHTLLVIEMGRRGYNHKTPLPIEPVSLSTDDEMPEPYDDQWAALRAKGCACKIPK